MAVRCLLVLSNKFGTGGFPCTVQIPGIYEPEQALAPAQALAAEHSLAGLCGAWKRCYSTPDEKGTETLLTTRVYSPMKRGLLLTQDYSKNCETKCS